MAQLSGLARIGRDAELRYTTDGTQVASLSLAFSYGKKDPNTKQKPTQWVDGALWGQRAESLAPYLLKGTLVYVVLDDAHIETFQKQDGSQGVKLSGRVSVIEFAARPAESQQQATQQPKPQPAPAQRSAPQQQASSLADMDDDIPF
ncbi:Single-stranded DNA-binding protein [plant metagenome]|uniref:Single-stranded DNA-binding protein n=1 Tax=plant metagenome TaxID=1297885 RepID=A0A484Q4F6_9ZZZZ